MRFARTAARTSAQDKGEKAAAGTARMATSRGEMSARNGGQVGGRRAGGTLRW